MEQEILVVLSGHEKIGQVSYALSQIGLQVTFAWSLREAIRILHTKTFAFFLLELSSTGADILMELTTYGFQGVFPYLIAAADFTLPGQTRAELLESGADACIATPIDMVELVAEIRAAIRRSGHPKLLRGGIVAPNIKYRDLEIDQSNIKVTMRGEEVTLTPKEYEILILLARHPGMVLTREQIYLNVWGTDYGYNATTISDHICSIRHKLGLRARDEDYIETVFGFGYRFQSGK